MLRFPAGLSEQLFLEKIWQRSPLLFRNAIQTDVIPCKEKLFQLSSEDAVESRMVRELTQSPFWDLQQGPFDEAFLTAAGDSHWTLLLQDMDKHLPQLAALRQLFQFIPRWRIDDIMISYAVDQGSVGPHLDEYDVFLIQAHGQRRWKIDSGATNDNNMLPDIDLCILEHFDTEEEWLLEPGDILYLPPGVAHWGVAEGECITASVGFRAPTSHDLLENWTAHLLEDNEAQRYSDPGRRRVSPAAAAEIGETDIDNLIDCLLKALPREREAMAEWFGCYLSEPKPHLYPDLPADEFNLQIVTAKGIQRHPYSTLLYRCKEVGITLYADGEAFDLPSELTTFITMLSNCDALSADELAPWLERDIVIELLETLYEMGIIYPAETPIDEST